MCLPLLIFPCIIKSRSSLLAPAYPGGPGTGRKTVVVVWWLLSSDSSGSNSDGSSGSSRRGMYVAEPGCPMV